MNPQPYVWQALPPGGAGYAHPLYAQPGPNPFVQPQIPPPSTQFIPCPSNYLHEVSGRHQMEQQERDKNRRLEETNKTLEEGKQYLVKEIERLKSEYEQLRQEKDSALEKLLHEKELHLANAENEKRHCAEELSKQLREQESENKKLGRDKLIIERNQLRLDNAKLVHDADQDDAEITNCQEQLQEINAENEQLRDGLKHKNSEISKLKQRLDKLQEKADNCRRRYELCEEDLDKGRQALERKEARIVELELKLKEAMGCVQELKRELDATNTKCAIAEKQAKYAEDELRRLDRGGTATSNGCEKTLWEQNNNSAANLNSAGNTKSVETKENKNSKSVRRYAATEAPISARKFGNDQRF
uniref:Myosin_tail_1 domain-containing protein n=1 Tax=Globodera pallida TaxID=36090 RepID=A0A183C5L1_GLOPA